MWSLEEEAALRSALAQRLRTAIQRGGWSHRKLADAVGVSKQSVTNWTQGTHEPSLRYLRRIARVLGVPLDDLIAVGERDEGTVQSPWHESMTVVLDHLTELRLRPALRSFQESVPGLLDVLDEAEAAARRLRQRREP